MARPEHKPSSGSREKVAALAGGGMAHWEIALVMGIARATLEKHYEDELSVGAAQARAGVLEAMLRAALKGNVSAAKFYLAHEPQLAAPPLEGGAEEESPTVEEVPMKPMGKKAQAERDAQTAAVGTDWENLLHGDNVVPMRGMK